MGGGLNPIGQVAVIVFVQVEFQNFIFAIPTVDFFGQEGFADFAEVSALSALLRIEEQVTGDLLGNGGCAGNGFLTLPVLPEGPDDGNRVKTRVAVIVFIFSSEGGGNDVGGHFVQCDIGSPPGVVVNNFVKQPSIPVQDTGGFKGGGIVFEFVYIWEVTCDLVILLEHEGPYRKFHDGADE